MTGRIIAFVCGAAIFAGFFLPWIEVSGLEILKAAGLDPALHGLVLPKLGQIKASGFDIISHNDTPRKTQFLLLMCPVSGILLVLSCFGKQWLTGLAAFIAGVGILGYPLWYIFKFFKMTTGLGLWMVIGAACFSIMLLLSFLISGKNQKKEKGINT
ncbi:MAG: hypothetical protein GY795_47375 [Desulfobacterales bacterium]|nr:hypothetical protein [Desulfobacterales bacterium]